jgi:hypothetical protein
MPANLRAVELLEEIVKKEGPVARACNLFAKECSDGMPVVHRLAVKRSLSSPHIAELFLGLDEAERVMYIESIVGSDDGCISI